MFNPFWKDVLESFADFIDHFPIDNITKFQELPLYFNHKFSIGHGHFYVPSWYNKGIRFVKDIINYNGTFLTRTEFEQKLGASVNFYNLKEYYRRLKNTYD